jgi:phage tail sheath protein FI
MNVPPRPNSIDGVETSVAAFVGPTARGPADRASTLLASLSEFERDYGGEADLTFDRKTRAPNYMWHAVRAFFANGGQRLYVARAGRVVHVAPTATDYTTALQHLEAVTDISIVAAPGASGIDEIAALIAHVERMRYRFAVIDSGPGQSSLQVGELRQRLNSPNAALYYPWLRTDSGSGARLQLPPSGFIAGTYARVDAAQGVYHSPTNQPISLVTGLQSAVPLADQDILNAAGVNCLRAFPQRGVVAWGARTLSTDPEWKYINVRRLLIFIEASIDRGLHWVVFEPNGETLWAAVTSLVEDFLTRQWRQGALQGTTAREAFVVRCDRTTMTQDDIDNGRLVCQVGVAPLRAAEFVIFRIGQWTAHRKP